MVSVVIPFYSNIGWLTEAIESVLKQSYNDLEIIVINDGSNEDDLSFLDIYAEKIKYFKYHNQGPAKARNIGIEKAQGEFIAFLDSDDLWDANKIEVQLSYMKENNLTWSHTSYSLFDDITGDHLREIDVSSFSGDVFIKCLISSPIATPCIMVKRDFLINNPEVRFSEKMRYGQDGFMWLNISSHEPLGVIPRTLSRVRIRGGNAALRAKVYLKVKAQIWDFMVEKMKLRDKRYIYIPFLIKIAYRFCAFNNQVMDAVERKFGLSEKKLETLARILYLPSYVLLKIEKFVVK